MYILNVNERLGEGERAKRNKKQFMNQFADISHDANKRGLGRGAMFEHKRHLITRLNYN